MSGIYIPGMEMPKSCFECNLKKIWEDGVQCLVNKGLWMDCDSKHKACPLIPVPDHGRLIDADALIDDMANMIPWVIESPEEIAMMDGLSAGYEAVGAAPTIIPADPADKEAQDG